ncbi:TatD family hydrolase [Photobacterium aphoticum]|uniref:Deoxyribonuclease n=1 Tax=Photobacterium aphoticum TaxID=754436 RepID=A0A0J1GLY6_9GAMM|nr:TatD family hydrolase [Photobacterium aphoticum]KLV00730.1 deoxyribonuclease [Photobacterium aphoticum]PSU58283.1 TatD family deoxyribonuclease [Photobacterium aphoticum]GHA50711.1 deoxyribonuclease [Photobacterium aphoticum]
MLIDSHCHFDFSPFDADPAQYLADAQQVGVEKLVLPAIGASNWAAVQALAETYAGVYYALGLHPFFSAQHTPQDIAKLDVALAADSLLRAKNRSKCVAVGECGLDFAIADADKDQQVALLTAQFQIANQYHLPVILHCRKAFPEMIRLLRQHTPVAGGVYHAFSGSYPQAKQLLDLGINIGVGGTITYPRANKTRQTIAALPLTALLLETDAPDMPIAGYQGQPNRPDRLVHVLRELAAIRGESEQEIARVVTLTTAELFGIPM